MSSKKRGRDDDDGDEDVAIGGTEGFTEHRNVCTELARPFSTKPMPTPTLELYPSC